MPDSNQGAGRLHKQLPQWLKAILFLSLCIRIMAVLSYGFIPPNSVRINLHNLRNEETYDTIFIGTSHEQCGIDPFSVNAASGGNSAGLCMANAHPDDMYHILRLICETQSPFRAVYKLDPSYWMNEQRSRSTQIFFYQEFPASKSGFFYFLDKTINLDSRSALAPWNYYRDLVGQVLDYIRRRRSTTCKNYDPSVLETPGGHYAGRGFTYRGRVAGKDKDTFSNIPWGESQIRSKAGLYFNHIAVLYRENGTRLTVITTPVLQEALDRFAGSYDQSHLCFKELLGGLGLEYYNFNCMKSELMNRSVEGYQDYDSHMDGIRAQEFSTPLGSFLNSLNQGGLTHSDYLIN